MEIEWIKCPHCEASVKCVYDPEYMFSIGSDTAEHDFDCSNCGGDIVVLIRIHRNYCVDRIMKGEKYEN